MKIFRTIKFKKWAKSRDIPKEIIDEIIYFQPPKSAYIEASKNMEPSPPLSYIGNIIRDNSEEFFEAPLPIDQRLFVIGSCPNGDFIVIDLKEDAGSVKYIAHEQLHDAKDYREISAKVSDTLVEFIERYVEDDDFPLDYSDV